MTTKRIDVPGGIAVPRASRFTLFLARLFGKRHVTWDPWDGNYGLEIYEWRDRFYVSRELRRGGNAC